MPLIEYKGPEGNNRYPVYIESPLPTRAGGIGLNYDFTNIADMLYFKSERDAANLSPENITAWQGALGLGSSAFTDTGAFDPAGSANAAQSFAIQRSNHTGTQLADTISNFDSQVRTNKLNQMAAPNGYVWMNSNRITGVTTTNSNGDAANVEYVLSKMNEAIAASDPLGSAASVLASSLQKSANLSDVSSVSTARTNLGLGSAAVANTGDFDPAGAAAAAQSAAIEASDINLANFADSQVAFWENETAYSIGNQVLYNRELWASLESSTGVTPGSDPAKWALLGTGGGGLPMNGDAYTIVVQATNDPNANGAAFVAAYDAAADMEPYEAPLSATNRVTILLPPGTYNCPDFDFYADYVDVVGLDAGRGACLPKWATASATDFRLANLTCGKETGGFIWDNFKVGARAENCSFGDWCIASDGGMDMAGTLINCEFEDYAVNNAHISGTIINCQARLSSFTGELTGDSPSFQGVTAGLNSFDLTSDAAKALLKDCVLRVGSFPNFASYPNVAVRDCVNGDGTPANYNPSPSSSLLGAYPIFVDVSSNFNLATGSYFSNYTATTNIAADATGLPFGTSCVIDCSGAYGIDLSSLGLDNLTTGQFVEVMQTLEGWVIGKTNIFSSDGTYIHYTTNNMSASVTAVVGQLIDSTYTAGDVTINAPISATPGQIFGFSQASDSSYNGVFDPSGGIDPAQRHLIIPGQVKYFVIGGGFSNMWTEIGPPTKTVYTNIVFISSSTTMISNTRYSVDSEYPVDLSFPTSTDSKIGDMIGVTNSSPFYGPANPIVVDSMGLNITVPTGETLFFFYDGGSWNPSVAAPGMFATATIFESDIYALPGGYYVADSLYALTYILPTAFTFTPGQVVGFDNPSGEIYNVNIFSGTVVLEPGEYTVLMYKAWGVWVIIAGKGAGGGGGTITLTGDVTGSGTGTFATTIAANAVTNSKAAQMATLTLKGNNTGSTADPIDLSVADVSTMLSLSSYLPLSGGTMTGHIELYGTASGAQAVSYTQVSTMLGSYLPLAGGTMTGHIELYGTASGVQAISYAQVASMVKGAVAQVGYYHSDSTVTSTPTSGKMTWDNATQISSTLIYINLLDGDGTDFFVFYELVGVNDTILIQDRNDSDNYQLWKVNATPTYLSSVFTFPVTLVSSGGTGTTNLPNNHDIFIYTNRAAVPVSTDQLPEGTTNLYFTTARVLATALTGFSASTNTVIVETDTVLQAFQKAQAQITERLSSSLTSAYLFVGNGSNVATGVALSGDATLANTGAITLASTAVTPAAYGSASSVATFTVDAKGRLTAASSTAIAIASSAVSGLGTLATQSGTFSGTSSGTNTGDQTITLTGDVTGSGTGSFAATIKTNAALAGSPTTTTQAEGDNSTKISTTEYAYRTVNRQRRGSDITGSVGLTTSDLGYTRKIASGTGTVSFTVSTLTAGVAAGDVATITILNVTATDFTLTVTGTPKYINGAVAGSIKANTSVVVIVDSADVIISGSAI